MSELIAVTGGRGFIGTYTMKRLEELGYEAVSVDRSEGLDILTNEGEVEDVLRYCSGVIHLAGVLGTAELFDEVDNAIEVNVRGTATILSMCQQFDLHYVGITMPQVWDNVYQATKAAATKLAAAYHRHYDVRVSHVRAYNVYGPGQKVGTPQKIFPTFANAAWRNEPLPVWGDGTQYVDLIYVEDVAAMLVDALGFGANETFDAGTGYTITVNEVAAYVLDHVPGTTSKVEYLPMRKGEHGRGVVAEGEGWDKLGWKPVFRLPALKETVESYRPR